MNIFVLDTNPATAARFHNDRHVVKMILESAQLMCSAHVFLDGEAAARNRVPLILRPTHINHPCAIWTRKSDSNYIWLHELMGSLLVEYRERYGKDHLYHASGMWADLATKPMNRPMGRRTPFAQCMPTPYKRADAVTAYRLYYFYEKQHIASWHAPAAVPAWWQELQRLEENRKRRAL